MGAFDVCFSTEKKEGLFETECSKLSYEVVFNEKVSAKAKKDGPGILLKTVR
jgi:hypothetical protein